MLIIKKAHKGTKILAHVQYARANYLRKVEKMQKIYELSIGICTSDRRIYLLIYGGFRWMTWMDRKSMQNHKKV